MGDKIYVDFTANDFEYCLHQILREIESYHEVIKEDLTMIVKRFSVDLKASTFFRKTQTRSKEKKIELIEVTHFLEWDDAKFMKWFENNQLNLNIYEYLSPCSYELFEKSFSLKRTAPEFFHSSLSKIDDVDFKSIARFSTYLDRLFLIKK